ncbi:MAG: Uma2 family endonuclease [Chloroherpetonaceae bacterium]
MENIETLTETTKEISDYELERGKPMPSFIHGITQAKLLVALSKHEESFTIGSEITLDLKPRVTPDILIFRKRKVNFQRDEKRVSEMPLTVIEILSGTQGMENFDEKLPRYFEAGVQSVWLVQPFIKTIAVFLPNEEPRVFTKGELNDPATGISLNLDEIFKS